MSTTIHKAFWKSPSAAPPVSAVGGAKRAQVSGIFPNIFFANR